MANTTVRGAKAVHGSNPINLVEQVIRLRIWESAYWKEECFALTAVSLIDKTIKLNAIGGMYDNSKPTQFICLLLKLLQIQPEKEILVEYLLVEEYKYLRALAAMYIRMTFRGVEVYELLEPLLNDYRKLRQLSMAGYSLTYMDEFIDKLLTEERACDIILPRLPKRETLEEAEGLAPRKSALLDAMEEKGSVSSRGRSKSRSRSRSIGSPQSGSRSRSRSRSPSLAGSAMDGVEDRFISRSPSRSKSRSRSLSRSRSPSVKMDTK